MSGLRIKNASVVSRQSFLWLSVLVLLAGLPHLFSLPMWVTGLALLATGGRLTFIRQRSVLQQGFTFIVLAVLFMALYFLSDRWLSADAIRSFFVVVVALKWGESTTRRDYLGLVFACCMLAGLAALYQATLWSLLYLLLVVLLLLLVLLSTQKSHLSSRSLLFRAGRLLIPALPIMALLFLMFPRLNGPLWDMGIALGLPLSVMLDQNKDQRGIEKTLKPGQIKRIKQSDDSILVAEFYGKVPYVSRLYWRGPVYWDFDGEHWTIPKGWNNRSKLLRSAYKSSAAIDNQMRIKTTTIEYNLRLLPHNERWMYALDIPMMTAPESFVSADFQLLSIRKTVREANMRLSANLDYAVGLSLSNEQRARALAWPEGSNPRLKELGLELKQKGLNSTDLSSHILGLFAQGDYLLGDSLVASEPNQSLDQFFFESKTGDVQQLASSLVMLMRAADVPARLVAGYRGGSIIALSDFVIVKKQHAHVWAEIWQTNGGWVRVEAKDAVVPPKVPSSNDVSPKVKPRPIEEITAKTVNNEAVTQVLNKASKQASKLPQESGSWFDDWQENIQKIFSSLQKWVVDYNPQRQSELLHGDQDQQKRLKLDELLLTGLTLSILMSVCYFLLMRVLAHRNKDPVSDAFDQFCRHFSQDELERASWECPSHYSTRLIKQFPQHTAAINMVLKNYMVVRYGSAGKHQKQEFVRQIKRFLAMI